MHGHTNIKIAVNHFTVAITVRTGTVAECMIGCLDTYAIAIEKAVTKRQAMHV